MTSNRRSRAVQARLGSVPTERPAAVLRAFTLIELLVVIGIIGLLMSILLPSLAGARAQGRLIKCLAHMRGLSQAAASFANDHQDRLQLATDQVGFEKADPGRRIYEYDENGELFAWPVALARYAGIPYTHNGLIVDLEDDPAQNEPSDEPRYGWGVRATSFMEASMVEDKIPEPFGLVLCPSDRIRIATPFYPRLKSAGNNGLKKGGPAWEDDDSAPVNTSYWGYLSFGINEDLIGAEVEESNNRPACWRAVKDEDEWVSCKGEFAYPPSTPCGQDSSGWRLQGKLDRVYAPASVGLIFDAGPDSESEAMAAGPQDVINLIISAQADGPYLSDFQQQFGTRMPTRRHQGGRINTLFADMHGEAVTAVEFSDDNFYGEKLPTKYAETNVRVSPYHPRVIEEN